MELSDIVQQTVHFFATNQAYMLIVGTFGGYSYSNRRQDFDVIWQWRDLPKEYDTLDYLNVSNSLIHNHGSGDGVCKDYAIATFDTYLSLVRINRRKDLAKNINLAWGWSGECGHMLIEFLEGNTCIPYECTMNTPPLLPENVKHYSQKTKEERTCSSSLAWVFGRTLPGSMISYPTIQALFFPGGIARFFYGAARWHWKKYIEKITNSRRDNNKTGRERDENSF